MDHRHPNEDKDHSLRGYGLKIRIPGRNRYLNSAEAFANHGPAVSGKGGVCPYLDAYNPCASIVTLNRKSIPQRPQPHFTFFTTIPSGKYLENILMFSLEFTLKNMVKNNISFSLYFPVKNSH
jgi:hypothetical protein